jgi:hypothetical protein
VGPVLIVEVLELPERAQEVALVPDERAVQELVPACLHPAFHDRIAPHRQLHLIRSIGTDVSG